MLHIGITVESSSKVEEIVLKIRDVFYSPSHMSEEIIEAKRSRGRNHRRVEIMSTGCSENRGQKRDGR